MYGGPKRLEAPAAGSSEDDLDDDGWMEYDSWMDE